MRIAIFENPANAIDKYGTEFFDDPGLSFLSWQIGILRQNLFGVDEVQLLG